MRLLLDTHAFAWAVARSSRLTARALDWITDPVNDVRVSAVSIYELDYKRRVDAEIAALPPDLAAAGLALGYAWLAVTPEHARMAASLDRIHKDPWDRMITGQALVEDLIVITIDPAISALGASVLW